MTREEELAALLAQGRALKAQIAPEPSAEDMGYAMANNEACVLYPGEEEGPLREAFRRGGGTAWARIVALEEELDMYKAAAREGHEA